MLDSLLHPLLLRQNTVVLYPVVPTTLMSVKRWSCLGKENTFMRDMRVHLSINEKWKDIVENFSSPDDYFLGTIVTYKNQIDGNFEIIEIYYSGVAPPLPPMNTRLYATGIRWQGNSYYWRAFSPPTTPCLASNSLLYLMWDLIKRETDLFIGKEVYSCGEVVHCKVVHCSCKLDNFLVNWIRPCKMGANSSVADRPIFK